MLNNRLCYQIFEIFFFLDHFWSLSKIFYLKIIILFVNQTKCSLIFLDLWISRKIDRCIISTLSWRMPLSYRNQSIDLPPKSIDWFLYDNGLRHERVKGFYIEKYSWGLIGLIHICYTSIIFSRILIYRELLFFRIILSRMLKENS